MFRRPYPLFVLVAGLMCLFALPAAVAQSPQVQPASHPALADAELVD